MPGSAEFVQRVVHAIEAGAASRWLRRSFILVVIFAIAVIFLYNFRGLANSQAMDQAQIGRSLAFFHGWKTNYVRPLAIGQLQSHGRDIHTAIWTDVYNAPLPPLVDAIVLFPVRSHLNFSAHQVIFSGDRAIAALGILLFFGSIAIQFFLTSRLFDRWLAWLSCSLILLCDTLWQYAVSGLPQMLLLFLFNLTLFALVRAIEERIQGKNEVKWLAATGAGFGLLALTHGLTIWMFIPALIFIGWFFPARKRSIAIVLGIFLVLYTPWLLRNWVVCGNPFGLGFYSVFEGLGHSETGWMRRLAFQPEGIGVTAFRDKILNNFTLQTGHLIQYFGGSLVAVAFFASLLHRFRRPEVSALRWLLLVMWAGAAFGMAVFGLTEEQGLIANQLHLLFVPIMTAFGLAWFLVQWNRLGVQLRVARAGFLALLFLLCGFPLANTLYGMVFGAPKFGVQWPPYVPPYIGLLNGWMGPQEVTASDMPWAIAWYADRRSILVPETVKTMTDLSDSNVLGYPIAALYMTPISGSENKFGDIMRGEYKDWAGVIQQNADLSKFPFKWGTLALGIDKQCAFLSDHDRSATPAK